MILDGHKNPLFIIRNQKGYEIERIELPLCDSSGMDKEFSPEATQKKTGAKTNKVYYEGFHYNIKLSYVEGLEDPDYKKVKDLINYFLTNHRVTMYPRIDNDIEYYEVNLIPTEIIMKISAGYDRADEHEGIELNFQTKHLQSLLVTYDPSAVPVVGIILNPFLRIVN